MAEFGQTGSWKFLPVSAVVALIAIYACFDALPEIIKQIRMRDLIEPNGLITILGSEPDTPQIFETYPDSEGFEYVPAMGWLMRAQKIVELFIGLFILGGFLKRGSQNALFPLLAYNFMRLYSVIWVVTEIGCIYMVQKGWVLDALEDFRLMNPSGSSQFDWPSRFWLLLAYSFGQHIIIAYMVADVLYSWLLITYAGGSGWELLPAKDLPGWDAYMSRKEKAAGRGPEYEDIESQMTPEQMMMLMQMMQQQQGGGGGPMMIPGMGGALGDGRKH